MIDQVKRLSRKLRTLVQAAKLRKRHFVHPQRCSAGISHFASLFWRTTTSSTGLSPAAPPTTR
ncbi:hypothetical protein F443_00631 [Phytophthora nicotianae P1569]|uniref:Uncharacterized protein n=1 Tax=Phytophthora nicotianae P1569 TaxID=1317065 RepID=V9FZU3_PHYNI|nr:hypothetical protein F443_00631 [Phytophthora nicotianae P1569]